MLDLSFGLPLSVRDAALKMIAPGPNSEVNREYYAQEHEKEIEEGRGAIEAYEKTDEKARDLLRRLANSQPYYTRQRQLDTDDQDKSTQKQIGYGSGSSSAANSGPGSGSTPGPIRTADSRKAAANHSGSLSSLPPNRKPRPVAGARAPQPQDWLPPQDPNIVSLFVTGVEDDLPEHAIRTFFAKFGQLRSVVCSHRAHCAFINFANRDIAEKAATECQGRAIIQGCPLRVRWGKPKPLDQTDREQRVEWAREGRQTAAGADPAHQKEQDDTAAQQEEGTNYLVAPPPGASGDQPQYASMAGD